MRKINTSDVFKMARIIKETKIKNTMIEMFENSRRERKKLEIKEGATPEEIEQIKKKKSEMQEEYGIKIFFELLEACSDAKMEDKLYELIAGIMEKTKDEIKVQSIDSTMRDIQSIVRENNFTNFLSKAGQLTD